MYECNTCFFYLFTEFPYTIYIHVSNQPSTVLYFISPFLIGSFSISIDLSIYLSIYLPIYLSIYLSIYVCICGHIMTHVYLHCACFAMPYLANLYLCRTPLPTPLSCNPEQQHIEVSGTVLPVDPAAGD